MTFWIYTNGWKPSLEFSKYDNYDDIDPDIDDIDET